MGRDVIVRCMVYRLECLYRKFDELSAQRGQPVDKCLHIIDVAGFSVKHLSKQSNVDDFQTSCDQQLDVEQ